MNVFNLFAKLTLDTSDFDKQVADASTSFDKMGDAAGEVSGDTKKAEKAVDDFAQSVEEMNTETGQAESRLNDTERALGDVGDEAKQSSKPLKDTADGLKDIDGKGGGAETALSKLGKTITGSVTKGLTLANIITKAADAISSFAEAALNMDETTEDFRVSMGKLTTAFETAGFSSTSAKKTFKEFYKILGDTDTAVEASQLLAKLTSNMSDQSRWTEIAAGVYGTFGDSLPINSLIEAANETAKTGQVTGVLADALNWVGISEDDFNIRLSACADTQERTAIITDTLTAAYNDAASAMKENNSVVMKSRDAQIDLQEAQAEVGEQISRLKTALTNVFSPSVEKVLSVVEKLAGKLADVAEEWAATEEAFRNPLPTESVEAAREQLNAWSDELVTVKEQLQSAIAAGIDEDAYWEYVDQINDLNSKITNGTTQLTEMEAAETAAAETANKAADAVDKMTVSANGFSVELSNSNLTLEEATERLTTYTDAATNMFSQISTESNLSYSDALANMRHNIDATNEFADNMASIAGELPAEMAEMFYSGGAEMYAGVVAMLAEASAGSDDGLAELRALWEEGGSAAIEAFAQSIGADNIDIAGEIAGSMDSDASVVNASENLVNRAADAVTAAVQSAGFDTAGANAVSLFISGMAGKRGDVTAAARSIAGAAAGAMNIGGGSGSGRAGGLDYVPYDGYPAILHRGESVLTKAEASDWRRGNNENAAGITIVQNIQSVPQTPVELASATAAYFETARWAI